MTLIHRSTVAVRRMWLKNKTKGKRFYTQLSPQVLKVSQTEPLADVPRVGSSGRSSSEGWAIPMALALVGLAFSTFSTHQLMHCRDTAHVNALAAHPSPVVPSTKQE